jgi:beta-fructofuranosidase/levanase/fructan beta-fructosidase
MWYEAGQRWIMTLAVFNRVSFYSSPDLINWTHESDFGIDKGSHAGVWECPDLIPMKVEGSEELKWVLLLSINPGGPQGGSATQYFVGEFDGSEFVLDPEFEKELVVNEAVFPMGEVFDDFEDDLNGWTITGEAFSGEPATDTLSGHDEVSGYSGEGLLSSLHGGDGSTGSMESREFVIDKSYINLKVGGGNDQTATYVALWIDGEEVSRVTGKNGDNLLVRSWDVSNYIGKPARLQVVDEHTGGWGHVLVDDIVFSDQPAFPMSE